MSELSKEIASMEEFKDALFRQSPIPITWAVWKYQAQQELIERQAAKIIVLKRDNDMLEETVTQQARELNYKGMLIKSLQDQLERTQESLKEAHEALYTKGGNQP